MRFSDYDIDTNELFGMSELLSLLKEGGESNRAFAEIRQHNLEKFGNELIWRYPISDGTHAGAFIVFVKEGFVSIPYDIIDAVDYEILELQQTTMFDAGSMQVFIDNWVSFSDDLVASMKEMKRVLLEG